MTIVSPSLYCCLISSARVLDEITGEKISTLIDGEDTATIIPKARDCFKACPRRRKDQVERGPARSDTPRIHSGVRNIPKDSMVKSCMWPRKLVLPRMLRGTFAQICPRGNGWPARGISNDGDEHGYADHQHHGGAILPARRSRLERANSIRARASLRSQRQRGHGGKGIVFLPLEKLKNAEHHTAQVPTRRLARWRGRVPRASVTRPRNFL